MQNFLNRALSPKFLKHPSTEELIFEKSHFNFNFITQLNIIFSFFDKKNIFRHVKIYFSNFYDISVTCKHILLKATKENVCNLSLKRKGFKKKSFLQVFEYIYSSKLIVNLLIWSILFYLYFWNLESKVLLRTLTKLILPVTC